MALIVYGADSDVAIFCFLNQLFSNCLGYREAKAPVTVGYDRVIGFFLNIYFGTGDNVAFFDAVTISNDPQNAVGVVARQVCVDQVTGH